MDTELDEWRSAVQSLGPLMRIANCGHTCRGSTGVCLDCGDDEPKGER